jgi:Ras GTPase-activating-like protein IQGAP2/3
MTVVKSTTFMQSVVFATFNWAENKREEYLLIKLFKSALQEEIRQKVLEPKDLMTSNALVVKITVNFYRGIGMSVHGSNSEQTGKASLRDILGAGVKKIIARSPDLEIDWNPRDIYRKWVQKQETESGKAAALRHDATIEEALLVPEVKAILEENLSTLCSLVEEFLNAITSSASSLPYGLRLW